jgi:hypothetical protein
VPAQTFWVKVWADTQTHVLLDSWYSAKRIWKAARQQGLLITIGLRSNRSLRVADAQAPRGWRWQTLSERAATLTTDDSQQIAWPSGGEQPRQVWVQVVSTRVHKLYRCQVAIVRESLEAPLKEVSLWASSDLVADATTLLRHIAARWDVEVLFADSKELLGLDQYQILSTPAIVHFWTLAAYAFLDEERDRLCQAWRRHVMIGDAPREVQRVHWCHLIDWMHQQFQIGTTPQTVLEKLAA